VLTNIKRDTRIINTLAWDDTKAKWVTWTNAHASYH